MNEEVTKKGNGASLLLDNKYVISEAPDKFGRFGYEWWQ